MRKDIRGFTLIELIVVIVIIGILSGISIMSYSNVRTDSEDSQRASRATLIAEALEKYYDANGEYPGCTAMTATPASTVTTATLKGLDPADLATPKVTSGTNSITCASISSSGPDLFSYTGDTSAACQTGTACSSFNLEYLRVANGDTVVISSRKGATN